MGDNSKDLAGVLGRTVKIEGHLESNQVIRFDGELKGTIIARNKLVMGKDGFVKGTIMGNALSIAGTVEGNIYAIDSIVLMHGANVKGQIFGKRVNIQEGAVISGFCKSGDFAGDELTKMSRKFSLEKP